MTLPNLSRIAAAAAMKPNGTAEAKEKAYAVWALQEAQMDMAALLIECAEAQEGGCAFDCAPDDPSPCTRCRIRALLVDFDQKIMML